MCLSDCQEFSAEFDSILNKTNVLEAAEIILIVLFGCFLRDVSQYENPL